MIHTHRPRPSAAATVPNLIVAGTTKSGTTSLHAWLSRHPEVAASRVKETGYFLAHRYDETPPPLSEYRELFAHCGDQPVIMESTPGYFYGGRAVAEAIRGQVGAGTRIIVVFRDPVRRAVSFFKYKKSRLLLDDDLSLDEYIDRCLEIPVPDGDTRENNPYWALEGGCYARYLDAWVDTFGDRLKIVFFELLRNEPRALLADLASWLGIDPTYFATADLSVENRTMGFKSGFLQRLALFVNDRAEPFWRANPRIKQTLRETYYRLNGRNYREVEPAALDRLEAFYRPWNQQLRGQLDALGVTELPNWLAGVEPQSAGVGAR